MSSDTINRRQFIQGTLAGIAGYSVLNTGCSSDSSSEPVELPGTSTQIALIKTSDRQAGVSAAMELLDFRSVSGQNVLLKPNFNTADPAPGSTHNDTLGRIITELQDRGASSVAVGERSYPDTQDVMSDKGIYALAANLGFSIINFEDMSSSGWEHFTNYRMSWQDGIYIPRAVQDAEYIVTTCCLKTHFIAGFTMSLKLGVGFLPQNMMNELHAASSIQDHIAEINLAYEPDLIVMDGVSVFTDGGPSTGTLATGDVIIAGTDRIAVDAVGLAVLKDIGSNADIMNSRIFSRRQIARAVNLGLGITSQSQIEFVTPDAQSQAYADTLRAILEDD